MDEIDRLLAYAQGRMGKIEMLAFEADLARRPDLQAELVALRAAAKLIGKERCDGR